MIRTLSIVLVIIVAVGWIGFSAEPIKIKDKELKERLLIADNTVLRANAKLAEEQQKVDAYLQSYKQAVLKLRQDLDVLVSEVFDKANIPEEDRKNYSFDSNFNLVKQEEQEDGAAGN